MSCHDFDPAFIGGATGYHHNNLWFLPVTAKVALRQLSVYMLDLAFYSVGNFKNTWLISFTYKKCNKSVHWDPVVITCTLRPRGTHICTKHWDSYLSCDLYALKGTREISHVSMAQRKTAVTPLLTHWSYCSIALSHRYIHGVYRCHQTRAFRIRRERHNSGKHV